MNGLQAVFLLFLTGFLGVMIYFIANIINIKLKKLSREEELESSNSDTKELKKQIGYIMAENEEIKEELRNLKYLIGDESRKIDLELQKEQIKLDRDNKYNL